MSGKGSRKKRAEVLKGLQGKKKESPEVINTQVAEKEGLR